MTKSRGNKVFYAFFLVYFGKQGGACWIFSLPVLCFDATHWPVDDLPLGSDETDTPYSLDQNDNNILDDI